MENVIKFQIFGHLAIQLGEIYKFPLGLEVIKKTTNT